MASLETRIDALYRQPLADFIPARAELARSLAGEQAKRVKALKKPTVVPWAVNQLFWSARATYDKLVKRGAALRSAQFSSLEGRRADMRQATDAHREALLASVTQTLRIAAEHGAHPDVDLLTRTLEALSLAAEPSPEPVGRMTAPLRPARGFEALAGAAIKAPRRAHAGEEAHAERQRALTIQKAERDVTKARARETQTRLAWDRAQADLETAKRKLADVQNS